MRPRNRPAGQKERRSAGGADKHNKAKEDTETEKALCRLLAVLYRKEAGSIAVRLSEFTLYRLENGVEIPKSEREAEFRSLILDQLDRDGVVNHRVVRRRDDRLRIIRTVLEQCVEADDVEVLTSRRQYIYRLSARQMKRQERTCREHDERVQVQREERKSGKKRECSKQVSRAL